MNNKNKLVIGIVAGEVSGDVLGADFMSQMNAIYDDIEWVGVGGPRMQEQGLSSLIDMNRLAVMGLVEVLTHLFDLLKARKQIVEAFEQYDIDCFIGIDAPDFNLRIGKKLKQSQILTNEYKEVYCVQYVSPSVWAWREKRINKIITATDLVLCLFPFELDIYKKYGHPAACVGHPLLDSIDSRLIRKPIEELRKEFIWKYKDLQRQYNQRDDIISNLICVMPGSRKSEVKRLLPDLVETMFKLYEYDNTLSFIIPTVNKALKEYIQRYIFKHHKPLIKVVSVVHDDNQKSLSQETMAISDFVILASGTATLEAMLLTKPMIVVYKLNKWSYKIASKLIKTPYISLPNIIANDAIVPELIQDDVNAERIASLTWQTLNSEEYQQQVDSLSQTRHKLITQEREDITQAFVNNFILKNSE